MAEIKEIEEAVATPESAGTSADTIDQHLAEFDAKTAHPSEPEPAPETVDALLRDEPAQRNPYEELAAHLDQELAGHLHRNHMRQEQADFDNYVKQAQSALGENANRVAPDHAERWLISEAMRDPKLKAAWDLRHDPTLDDGTRRRIGRILSGAIDKMSREVEQLPDPEATADRELVAQAVRSAGGRAPAEPQPDLGKLSNRELNKFTEQFGFEAI